MATRKPLVLNGGQVEQLQSGDNIGNLVFTRGGTLVNTIDYVAAMNVPVWIATCACVVTNVKGYRVGGNNTVAINARRNGSATKHLATDKTLANADTWYDGGAVQDATYAIGDKLEIMVVVAAGNPTQIAIQVDFTRS